MDSERGGRLGRCSSYDWRGACRLSVEVWFRVARIVHRLEDEGSVLAPLPGHKPDRDKQRPARSALVASPRWLMVMLGKPSKKPFANLESRGYHLHEASPVVYGPSPSMQLERLHHAFPDAQALRYC